MTDRPVAIVTGASRGIGKSVALTLHREGFDVVLVARSEASLTGTADEAAACGAGGSTLIMPVDLAKPGSEKEIVEAAYKKYGRIDLLVNNAGLGVMGTLEVSPETFDRLLDVNLKAPYALMKEVVPIMREQGRGYIVNIASRNGKIGFADWGAYSATKFGLVGLSESVYRELSGQGIKVTTLCPSWVNTDMASETEADLPPSEMVQPEDMAQTILWLLKLSPAVAIRELTLECRNFIE